jgi:uncharacterized protein DUF1353
MSSFTELDGALVLTPSPPARGKKSPNRRWRVAHMFVWHMGRVGSGLAVTIGDDFQTDLASVPRWLRWLINPADARYAKASVLHDYLLSRGRSPGEAAGVFHAALRADKVGRLKAFLMTAAVLAVTGAKGFVYSA